jgi:LacI family transcriptional regulator
VGEANEFRRRDSVTMSHVAAKAGVSATTVSHVLNKSRRIDPATERAVLAAIKQTGYVNDRVARSLRTGKTRTIGLAISAISNPYFGDAVHAIERRVTAHGHSLLLADTHDEPERELRAVTDLLAHRPDGILIAPSAAPTEALSMIARRRVATVMIDRVLPDFGEWRVDAVGVENVRPTAELVRHLADLGHTRIALIAGRRGLQTTEERVEGFRDGYSSCGLVPNPPHIEYAGDSIADAVDRLLALDSRPTAIVMGNNQVTIHTMRRLVDLQMVVPRDLSIACFDDFPWADLFHPRLTAIRQPVEELAYAAVEMLFERLKRPELEARSVRLEPTLIVRDSSARFSGEAREKSK